MEISEIPQAPGLPEILKVPGHKPRSKTLLDKLGDAASLGEVLSCIGKEVVRAKSLAYVFSAAILFASGFSAKGCSCVNENPYSMEKSRIAEKELGNEENFKRKYKLRVLETDGKDGGWSRDSKKSGKEYFFKVDDEGNIKRVYEIKRVVTYFNSKFRETKTEIETLEYKMVLEGEKYFNMEDFGR